MTRDFWIRLGAAMQECGALQTAAENVESITGDLSATYGVDVDDIGPCLDAIYAAKAQLTEALGRMQDEADDEADDDDIEWDEVPDAAE